MLRIKEKQQLLDLLQMMQEMHGEFASLQGDALLEALQDCQQAAIVVGEKIEKKVEEDTKVVPLLEQYCEELFALTQVTQPEEVITISTQLSATITEVTAQIEKMNTVYQIVFMPYKADMWDSLESIWKAFRKDPRCECIVMPIPYFCYDGKKQQWNPAYDGEKFPEDVVIMDYRAYSIQEEQPELAFIHNPYDKYNWVTNVHPQYYSYELKKHVGKLVYVPYYVTSGKISDKHLALSAYEHMDYMIAQSEYFKETCKGMFYYDKILPFGSPKFDRIIHKCAESVELEPEWAEVLQGKKTLMLNTSIRCFLLYSEIYLQKLWNLFRWMKGRDDIAIIWRPHPLLQATIDSIRTGLKEQFQELKQFFVDEKIGVLDTTPDITRTVAIADGYIGESASSVVHLFGAAGKPIFVLDNFVTKDFGVEKRRMLIADMHKVDGKWWAVSWYYNGLFSMDDAFADVQFETRIDNQPNWESVNYCFLPKDRELYMSPMQASTPVVVDTITGKQREILAAGPNVNLLFNQIFKYKDKVFFLPAHNKMILEYDTNTYRCTVYKDCIIKLAESSDRYEKDVYFLLSACVQDGKKLWVTAEYTNHILCFDMETGKSQFYELGDESSGYGSIAKEGETVWLEEAITGNVVEWNTVSGQTRILLAPQELQLRKKTSGRVRAYTNMLKMGNSLICAPAFSNGMVRFDLRTGAATMLIADFWEDVDRIHNGYRPDGFQLSCFMKQLDEHTVFVQRLTDLAAAVINVETEEYEVVYPTITEESFARFMERQDGFEKNEEAGGFFRKESRVFSLEGFIDDLVNNRLEDVKKRQKEELVHMGANLDGSCGEKVHEYMMTVLDAEAGI